VKTLGLEDNPYFDFEWYSEMSAVVAINSFGLEGDSKDAYRGGSGISLCTLGSYFNHSCDPNATKSSDELGHLALFRTSRNVSKGEEITLPYID